MITRMDEVLLDKASKIGLDELNQKILTLVRLERAVEMDMAQSMKRHELKKDLDDLKEQTSYFMERVGQEISTAVRK